MHPPLSLRVLLVLLVALVVTTPASADPLEDSLAQLGERLSAKLAVQISDAAAADLLRWQSESQLASRALPANAAGPQDPVRSRMSCSGPVESLECTVRPERDTDLAATQR